MIVSIRYFMDFEVKKPVVSVSKEHFFKYADGFFSVCLLRSLAIVFKNVFCRQTKEPNH